MKNYKINYLEHFTNVVGKEWLSKKFEKRTRKLWIMILTIAIIVMQCGMFAKYPSFANAKSFPDVPSNHWGKAFIDSLSSKEIITGYPDGSFKPNENVKINEFIAMTVKALGYSYESKSSDWSKPYVDKAIELKLILDREFTDYNAQINREQMTSIIVNAVVLKEYRPTSTLDTYVKNEMADYHKVSDYYKQNIIDSYKFGIVTGYPDKTFRPKNNSTRAEASAVIINMLTEESRKPFVQTDAKYVMMPVNDLDEYGNDIQYQKAFYAPLYQGKPVNELVDIAEMFMKLSDGGKGYLAPGLSRFGELYGFGGYPSKVEFDQAKSIENIYERTDAMINLGDITFVAQFNDFSSQYRPYQLAVTKNYSRADYNRPYSEYFLERYGDQMKPLFKYLFESDYDKAWQSFIKALDYQGNKAAELRISYNGRQITMFYTTNNVNLYISLKK